MTGEVIDREDLAIAEVIDGARPCFAVLLSSGVKLLSNCQHPQIRAALSHSQRNFFLQWGVANMEAPYWSIGTNDC